MAKVLQFAHMKWLTSYLIKPPMDKENFRIYSSETAKMAAILTYGNCMGQRGDSKSLKIVVWGYYS